MTSSVNINIGANGAIPTPPSSLRDSLVALVSSSRPGYTANLPGSLIEDIASTSIGALTLIDQAAVDLINSMTPSKANPYLLSLLGNQAGIVQGKQTNSSAYVTFIGIAGFAINRGFVVSDGLNQYTVQDGGVLGNATPTAFTGAISGTTLTVTNLTSGQLMVGDPITGAGVALGTVISAPLSGTGGNGTYQVNNSQTVTAELMAGATHGTVILYVVANQYGTWAIPPNTITQIVTSVPANYPVFCTNINAGTISSGAESSDLYRARVLNAGIAPAIGTLSYLKSLISNVPGVQSRLVSVSGAGKIIVGGGDPYAVAGAIYKGLFDIGDLQGSSTNQRTWTATGAIAGNILTISGGVTGSAIQVGDIVQGVNVANPTIITGLGTGTGGNGTYYVNYSQVVNAEAMTGTASNRNQIIAIVDYPDTYWILFVVPVQETVQIACSWSTTAPNFTANTAIADAINPALVNYINSIPVGVPINVLSLQQIALESISNIISPSLISALTFVVTVNGTIVTPSPGTGLIPGDAEGFYLSDATKITVTRV